LMQEVLSLSMTSNNKIKNYFNHKKQIGK